MTTHRSLTLAPRHLALALALCAGTAMAQPAADTKPAEPKPAETKPVEAKPADAPKTAPEAFTGEPTARKELASGVVVEDFAVGAGAVVQAANAPALIMHYRSMLKGNTAEIDSTYRRSGGPALVHTAKLVDGLREGLVGMHVGGKRRITVPGKLARADQELKDAKGKVIVPANADVVYEVSLVAALIAEDEIVGTGDAATSASRVRVKYVGTFASDGREFDRSPELTAPGQQHPEFNLESGVVAGWSIGINGMKVGGKRRLMVPWQLAYGERGRGTGEKAIPPRADLNFVVELVEVVKPPVPAVPGSTDSLPPPTPGTPAQPDRRD